MHEKLEQLQKLREEFDVAAKGVNTPEEVEELRIRFLGRKGIISALFKEIGSVPAEVKGDFGKQLNMLKQHAANAVDSLATGGKEKRSASSTRPPAQDALYRFAASADPDRT